MLNIYRRFFFNLFAIFFIVLMPFILVLSLGYDYDGEENGLGNNLTIQVETFPRGAVIKGNEKDFTTPAELRVPDGRNAYLNIAREDYKSEKFLLKATADQNSTARITDLWLLPEAENNRLFSPKNQPLDFLSDTFLLLRNEDTQEYFVQTYSFGGLIGEGQEIRKRSRREIKPGHWVGLDELMFWERSQGFILYRSGPGSWSILDLQGFDLDIVSVVKTSENQILILDKSSHLWIGDLTAGDLTFLDTGFDGLTFSKIPNNIWLAREDTIYQIPQNRIEPEQFILTGREFFSDYTLIKLWPERNLDYNSFKAESLFLGTVFKVGQTAIYFPDANPQVWQVMSLEVSDFSTDESNFMWLDNDNNLYQYNIFLNIRQSFGKLDLAPQDDPYQIAYFSRWKRIMIYSKTQVFSVWIDNQSINEPILRYFPVLWIEGMRCYPKVLDNYQFCLDGRDVVDYKNNVIPW